MMPKRYLVDLITLHLSRIVGDEISEGEVLNLITAIRMMVFPSEGSGRDVVHHELSLRDRKDVK